ncbi:MAG: response regulator transcription factor [Bacteroidaceae bacterium]|nr:response regulator transcription factor [Bacteroidaceae bacterium]
MSKRILIVDDEPDISEILRFNLEMEGYDVLTAEGADEAQQIVESSIGSNGSIDLILLDVMMTPKSGFEWAEELKADPRTRDIPIIFCTAKTLEEDMLHGFALGSDDYICKPFRVSEVKARVKAVMRRGEGHSGAPEVTPLQDKASPRTIVYTPSPLMDGRGGVVLDLDRKECRVDGEEVAFTKLEFELLALLLSRPGQVFSREEILRTVWPSDAIVLDRTVDVNITRIRKKIGRYGECLRTKFGYGYMFT